MPNWTYRPPAARPGIRAARAAREQLGLDLLQPLADVLDAAEALGPPVAVLDLDDDVAGAYLVRPRGELIFVNRVHAVQRQRFTLAHELGHHRLHHPAHFDRPKDLADFSHDDIEVAANWFASEFLMPFDAAKWWADENLDGPATLEHVVRFACAFGVSAKAACIRLQNAGRIPDEKRCRALHTEIDGCVHYGMPETLGLSFIEDRLGEIKENGAYKPFG